MAKRTTQNKKKLRRKAQAAARAKQKSSNSQQGRFCLMAKPIGPACNLRCRYCFYLEKEALFAGGENFRMSDEVLEAYIRKYLHSQPPGDVQFSWQGGEPALMGLDFYRKVMRLQQQYARGQQVNNTLQTNGTLLDDDWGAFLAANDWLVGLSLDGPEDIHNANRLDARGNGSFDAVMRGLDVLHRHTVQFNVLACVSSANADRPLDVYRFLRDVGVEFVQWMPIVERLPDEAANDLGLDLAVGIRSGERLETVRMTAWSVTPEAYGDFLCRVFDEWVRHDVGSFNVMNFEWALANYMKRPAGVCQWMPCCGRSPIIEHNGDVYACDHYVYPEYRLGNVLTDDLTQMMDSPAQCAFGTAKLDDLPEHCRTCPVGPACWGECPKRRFLTTPDGEPGLNYLCEGYKRFFNHAAPYLHVIAQLVQSGRPASEIMNTDVRIMPRGGYR